MEEFIRNNFGNELADSYRDSTETVQTQIDLNFISVLATGTSNQPVSLEKETIIKDGKLRVRYILEAEVHQKK
ncbi:hypothetical protein BAU15_05435 [Enterococcus sp. JM4C]|uniref:hypothetical protein n=1 Tax=Candidatus Enterococcus huntleyi TaxID=1857217 RepID=UPI00137A6844|nr:hypothetical protein [Enterococcus sp. JM4C]KAF1295281.1 hypothetical protein BAU15_05435 [Enterococcus sp. JM4C]